MKLAAVHKFRRDPLCGNAVDEGQEIWLAKREESAGSASAECRVMNSAIR
jgi:hypothetical protein